MNDQTFTEIIVISIFVGVVGGVFLVAYSDGMEFQAYKKARCKMGMHKFKVRIGGYTTHKYYCEFCKCERKHPKLKLVDGGKKWMNNNYKF